MAKELDQLLYLRFRKRVYLKQGEEITLGRVAQLFAAPDREDKLRSLVLCRPDKRDGNMVLIDILQVVKQVTRLFPDMRIEQFGEPYALVEITAKRSSPNWLLVGAVWLLLFFGSGLAVMNFHADVSMLAVHRRIYQLLTGKISDRPYLLQIPYSFGIGLGMVLFFNHLFKKKFNEEPSPLEVEMYLYQENMNQYIITEEYGKMNREGARPHEGNTR
jgi:stage V sporulation protein AA